MPISMQTRLIAGAAGMIALMLIGLAIYLKGVKAGEERESARNAQAIQTAIHRKEVAERELNAERDEFERRSLAQQSAVEDEVARLRADAAGRTVCLQSRPGRRVPDPAGPAASHSDQAEGEPSGSNAGNLDAAIDLAGQCEKDRQQAVDLIDWYEGVKEKLKGACVKF